MCELNKMSSREEKRPFMILHNDIWGDTSVTLIEEIDSQFLIVRELNMLALYSRLDKEQSKTLQKALTTFYEILFSSKDKANINGTVPFTPASRTESPL